MCDVKSGDCISYAQRERAAASIANRCVDSYGRRYAGTQCPSYRQRIASNACAGKIAEKKKRGLAHCG